MIVGMDFGTTNSGIASYDGRQVRLLPLDPANANPAVARTALYITNDQSVNIGREAVNRYFEENVGRPVALKRVWVGEVEVYGADMFYVTDIYVWMDVMSPGRLFLSIKSGLRDPEYQGTVVGQYYYSLENLIATYMSMCRIRAERLLGREVRQVVLGRPVYFADDPKADTLAQRRLLEAAFRAGFEKVYLQHEPVAAAYNYATQVAGPQNVLVFDFGGGTLDITIMRLDGPAGNQVLASGGIPLAGDRFDQKLVRARLPKHFGEGSRYSARGRRLPLPQWVYDVFSDWQRILELQTPKSRKLLEEIAQTADDRPGIEALNSLVTNNYGLKMFDVVEAAKRRLSGDMATIIRFSGPGFRVSEMVTRSDFEQIIRAEIQAIEDRLDETLLAAGLAPEQIDAVVRTGGSAQIPAFRYMLMEKFGAGKVMATDTFSSVTSGLGIIAHGISQGTIDAQAYTASDLPRPERPAGKQDVASVNLALLQRRMAAQEDPDREATTERPVALVLLDHEHGLRVQSLPTGWLAEHQPHDLSLAGAALRSALLAAPDEPLLLVTSRYRFMLTSAGHLLELQGLSLPAAEYLRLRPDEVICAVSRWAELKRYERLLLATSRGYARAYDLALLIESIEGPVPLQFDQPLPGLPLAVLGADDTHDLFLILDNGRAVRHAVGQIPLTGIQAVNRRNGERIAGALSAGPDAELLLATDAGFGRRLPAGSVPVSPKANDRGRVIISRRPVRAIAQRQASGRIAVITSERLLAFEPEKLPLDEAGSTKSFRVLKLKPGEEITALIS